MSNKNDELILKKYENSPIRTAWDEEKEEWYFSVVDVWASFRTLYLVALGLLENKDRNRLKRRKVYCPQKEGRYPLGGYEVRWNIPHANR